MPVIVGGIGDSGTRGVQSALEALGVYMMSEEASTNRMRDSILFTAPLYWCNLNHSAYSCCGKPVPGITTSIRADLLEVCSDFQRECCPTAFPGGPGWLAQDGVDSPWDLAPRANRDPWRGVRPTAQCRRDRSVAPEDGCGFDGIAGIARRMMERHRQRAIAAMDRSPGQYQHWGFKHPRSSGAIPLLHQALGEGAFKYGRCPLLGKGVHGCAGDHQNGSSGGEGLV